MKLYKILETKNFDTKDLEPHRSTRNKNIT